MIYIREYIKGFKWEMQFYKCGLKNKGLMNFYVYCRMVIKSDIVIY